MQPSREVEVQLGNAHQDVSVHEAEVTADALRTLTRNESVLGRTRPKTIPSGKAVLAICSAAGAYAGGIEYWIVYLSDSHCSQDCDDVGVLALPCFPVGVAATWSPSNARGGRGSEGVRHVVDAVLDDARIG